MDKAAFDGNQLVDDDMLYNSIDRGIYVPHKVHVTFSFDFS